MISGLRVPTELTGAKRRIVDRLKRAESATAPQLADEFGLTDTAIRQHLESLESAGLVERTHEPSPGRGRPPVHWRLTSDAATLFADRHADLTLDLIGAIQDSLGDSALRTVLEARATRQAESYRAALDHSGAVSTRVHRLAELRSAEGYLAEVVDEGDAVVLVERHCPIGDAARVCGDLCDAELVVFRTALGPTVSVTREQHLLSGDHRCAYRVTSA